MLTHLEVVDNDDNNKTTTRYAKLDNVQAQASFTNNLSEYLDDDSVNDIMNILTNEIGFSESELKFDRKLDGAEIYSVYLDGENYMMVALDGEYRIWNNAKVLYEDGVCKMSKQDIDDREITLTERSVYWSFAKEIIESCLKNASSAKFPSLTFSDDIAMKKNKDLVVVQSYVTATNSFGANIQEKFTVEFQVLDMDNYTYNPVYINFEGKTSGTFIDIDSY